MKHSFHQLTAALGVTTETLVGWQLDYPDAPKGYSNLQEWQAFCLLNGLEFTFPTGTESDMETPSEPLIALGALVTALACTEQDAELMDAQGKPCIQRHLADFTERTLALLESNEVSGVHLNHDVMQSILAGNTGHEDLLHGVIEQARRCLQLVGTLVSKITNTQPATL